MQLMQQHVTMARKLGNLPAHQNPLTNPDMMASLNPTQQAHAQAIAGHPRLRAMATANAGGDGTSSNTGPGGSGGAGPDQTSATDPTGATNPNRAVAYGSRSTQRRLSNIRHQLLGFQSVALAANGVNQVVKAKPQVGFKGERIVVAPTVVTAGGSLSQFVVGNKSQMAGNTTEPFEVYGPDSYAGEVDFDICQAAIDISALANTTGAVQFYACLVGLVQAKPIRPKHTKVMPFGLGATSVAAGASAQIVVNPQVDFVVRKIALTEGATFADAFVINSILAGNSLQLASQDPVPASVFTDRYDLYLDLDLINAAVALTFNVTNISGATAIFQGTTRGDVDPSQMSSSALAFAA